MVRIERLSKRVGPEGLDQKYGMLEGALIIYVYLHKLRDGRGMSYNAFNQLIQTQVGHLKTQYTYDQNGDLVEKQDQSQTSAYQYDDNRKLVGVNGQILGDQNIKQNPVPVVYDQLGSVIGYVENDQYNPIHYDAFGEADEKTKQTQYATYPYITEADLYVAGYRTYDSQNKRFIQEDTYDGTAHNPISQNHYLYCWNNPTKYVDVTGYAPNLVDSFKVYAKYKTYQKVEEFKDNIVKPAINTLEKFHVISTDTYAQQVVSIDTQNIKGVENVVHHSVINNSSRIGVDIGTSGAKTNISVSIDLFLLSFGVSGGDDGFSTFGNIGTKKAHMTTFYKYDKQGGAMGASGSGRVGDLMTTVEFSKHRNYKNLALVGIAILAIIFFGPIVAGIASVFGSIGTWVGGSLAGKLGFEFSLFLFLLIREKLNDKSKAFSLPLCQFFIG